MAIKNITAAIRANADDAARAAAEMVQTKTVNGLGRPRPVRHWSISGILGPGLTVEAASTPNGDAGTLLDVLQGWIMEGWVIDAITVDGRRFNVKATR